MWFEAHPISTPSSASAVCPRRPRPRRARRQNNTAAVCITATTTIGPAALSIIREREVIRRGQRRPHAGVVEVHHARLDEARNAEEEAAELLGEPVALHGRLCLEVERAERAIAVVAQLERQVQARGRRLAAALQHGGAHADLQALDARERDGLGVSVDDARLGLAPREAQVRVARIQPHEALVREAPPAVLE